LSLSARMFQIESFTPNRVRLAWTMSGRGATSSCLGPSLTLTGHCLGGWDGQDTLVGGVVMDLNTFGQYPRLKTGPVAKQTGISFTGVRFTAFIVSVHFGSARFRTRGGAPASGEFSFYVDQRAATRLK